MAIHAVARGHPPCLPLRLDVAPGGIRELFEKAVGRVIGGDCPIKIEEHVTASAPQ